MLYIFDVWYIEFHRIARSSLIILMILFGVCLPSAEMNARNVFWVECIDRLLNFLPWSIYLHLSFDDPLDLDEVKLFLCVLIHLSISALLIFESFSSLR